MKKLIAALLIVALSGCAISGTTLVTGEQREPVPAEAVKVYSSRPASCAVIATLSSQATGFTNQGAQDAALVELKKRAGRIGANGIVIQQVAEWTVGIRQIVSAEAVYVP